MVEPEIAAIAVPAGMPGPEIHSLVWKPDVLATPVITSEPLVVVPVVVVPVVVVLVVLVASTIEPPLGTCRVRLPAWPLTIAGAPLLPNAGTSMKPPRVVRVELGVAVTTAG